jgi:hypothetical protein
MRYLYYKINIMQKKFLIGVLLILGFCSFKGFGQTPVQFNNQMSAITDSLMKQGTSWGKKLGEIVQGSKQYQDLAPVRLSVQNYIDQQTLKLTNMADISGSSKFQQVMLTYLQFEKSFCEQVLKPFESFTSATTNEEIKTSVDHLIKEAAKEKDYTDQIHIVQNEYAKANNYVIETKKE